MPHRLRRVIGVNIRNPRDGGTSMRFAQLDTRGAVMAVGPNGVGKTSFLRLIPLFYGALPSRILRGSGHTSMVRHILPDPTSAVVFEYERDSESDLRCVVMHAAPEAEIDAPVFHIIASGFEERFLTDDEGSFLRRDEFKSRVEGFHIEVSQQLSLSQYRSIILNSVGPTKDALKFRRLAAQHSLSPGTLHGLDQIAAAMGPEAISFQVLQEIVVDQVAMELTSDGKMTRELKKSAGDVMKWLESYDHLAKLQARADDAKTLAEQCVEIEATDNTLRELRRAVTDLAASLQEKHQLGEREIERVRTTGEDTQTRLAQEATAASQAWQELKHRVAGLKDSVDLSLVRQKRFEKLGDVGAKALEAEQALEASIRAAHQRLLAELQELENRAQGIVVGFTQRRSAVNDRLAREEIRIGGAESAASHAYAGRMDELRKQEDEARQGLRPPARIEQIGTEISGLDARVNLLKGELRNPAASDETQRELDAVRDKLPEARGLQRTAEKARNEAREELRGVERARDELLVQHERATVAVQAAQDAVQALQQQLKPPAGSLLEFMRAAKFDDRGQVAKVLDPSLLLLAGLRPQEILDVPDLAGSTLAVGPVALDLQDVAEPEWLEAASVREQLQRAQDTLAAADAASKEKATKLQAANNHFSKASAGLAQRESELAARNSDVDRLDKQEQDLRRTAANEAQARKLEIGNEVAVLADEIGRLQQECAQLRKEHAAAGDRLAADFCGRRATAQRERDDAFARLADERREAQARSAGEQAALDTEEVQELTRANVDTGHLAKVREEVSTAGGRLAKIALWRDEVDAWRTFRDGDLARLPLLQEQLRVAEQDRTDAQMRQTAAQEALEEDASTLRDQLADLDRLQETYAADTARLEALLAQELHVIGEPRRATVVQTWSADELAMRVGKERRRLADATAQVDDMHRSIRNQMLAGREGPVQDWLLQREEERRPLLEGQPDHLATLQRGRLIGQWFEGAAADSINALHIELNGVLAIAAGFVTFLDTFDRKVGGTNSDLRGQLASVKSFPAFRDLDVHIRSTVRDLDYLKTLRDMKALSESQVSMSRFSGRMARQTELPGQEVVALMRSFRDLLHRDAGIRANLSELVRLECSLTINGKPLRITDAEEFKRHASNGTTGMIVGMFLMGFAGVVRKRAAAPVRVTWITDEVGRFDSENLQVFLKTLDENNIDVISARPEADPSTLDLFDTEARFGLNGKISTARLGVDEWEAQDVVAA